MARSPLSSLHLFLLIPWMICSVSSLPQGLPLREKKFNNELENSLHPILAMDQLHPQIPTSQTTPEHEDEVGYPFMFSRKMSSLLSEATHLLQRVKDIRERRWLQAFIHRLGSLAADLQKHPSPQESERKSKDKVAPHESLSQKEPVKDQPTEKIQLKDVSRLIPFHSIAQRLHTPEHEDENANPNSASTKTIQTLTQIKKQMPFHPTEHDRVATNQIPEAKLNAQETTNDNKDLELTSHEVEVNRERIRAGAARVDDEDDLVQQLHFSQPQISDKAPSVIEHPRGMIDVKVWTPTSIPDVIADDNREQKLITQSTVTDVEGNKKKILEEINSQIHKLRELGGSEDDVLQMWKQTDANQALQMKRDEDDDEDSLDFDYEEQGAAAGELDAEDTMNERTVAPSLVEIKSKIKMAAEPPVDDKVDKRMASVTIHTLRNEEVDDEDDDIDDDLVRQLQEEKFLSTVGHLILNKSSEYDNPQNLLQDTEKKESPPLQQRLMLQKDALPSDFVKNGISSEK